MYISFGECTYIINTSFTTDPSLHPSSKQIFFGKNRLTDLRFSEWTPRLRRTRKSFLTRALAQVEQLFSTQKRIPPTLGAAALARNTKPVPISVCLWLSCDPAWWATVVVMNELRQQVTFQDLERKTKRFCSQDYLDLYNPFLTMAL